MSEANKSSCTDGLRVLIFCQLSSLPMASCTSMELPQEWWPPLLCLPASKTLRQHAKNDAVAGVITSPRAVAVCRFGGNIDNWRVGEGTTMYYRSELPGARLILADTHACEIVVCTGWRFS